MEFDGKDRPLNVEPIFISGSEASSSTLFTIQALYNCLGFQGLFSFRPFLSIVAFALLLSEQPQE